MKKWLVISALVLLASGFRRLTMVLVEPAEIRSAINKSIPLLEYSSHTFLTNADPCHSCHGQGIGVVAFSLAREKGFTVTDSAFDEALGSIRKTWKRRTADLAQAEDPAALAIGAGYDLWAIAASKSLSDKQTALLTKNLLQHQCSGGNWVSPNGRPPSEYYAFSATAMAVKAIQHWLPPVFDPEVEIRLKAAIRWMTVTVPEANEEKIFQLLGLHWAGSDTAFIRHQGLKLIRSQRADGGWSQLPALSSDAYATGQALFALKTCGIIPVTDPAYQKGLAYLLKTQYSDGSWLVKTRSFPSVDYVDSGFPHAENQFISAAGTNWAMMALLLAVNQYP